jgi:hypothetical protein
MTDNLKYKTINNTSYNVNTDDMVILTLEAARRNQTRIIVDYGDVKTGKSWHEVYDVTGRIGRSTGDIKVPILLHNKRSIGGSAILDSCIIKISESKGKKVLYKHSGYDLSNVWL